MSIVSDETAAPAVIRYVAFPQTHYWQVLACYSEPQMDLKGRLKKQRLPGRFGRRYGPTAPIKYNVIRSISSKHQALTVANALNTMNNLPLHDLK